ncbi:MAG: hypothetical protein HF314_09390 [Ignavibacteria bacterium]|jgi:hypothetical protein|nr:hypothetical protein [Ignavibacteria bacterium]MCU7503276.1 hypothetical protein [Ignavibacteria bacterium]MCU7515778.1 hypothetical protein [Ignavibacteria bacterium]
MKEKKRFKGGIFGLLHAKALSRQLKASLCFALTFALPLNLFLNSRFSYSPKEETNTPQQIVTFISSGDLLFSGEVLIRSLDKTVQTGNFNGITSSLDNGRQVKFRYFITIFPGNFSKEVRTKTFLTSHFATDT